MYIFNENCLKTVVRKFSFPNFFATKGRHASFFSNFMTSENGLIHSPRINKLIPFFLTL